MVTCSICGQEQRGVVSNAPEVSDEAVCGKCTEAHEQLRGREARQPSNVRTAPDRMPPLDS